MNILGIALIVMGFAMLCSGLIFYRSSEESEEQATCEANGAGRREEKKEPPRDNVTRRS